MAAEDEKFNIEKYLDQVQQKKDVWNLLERVKSLEDIVGSNEKFSATFCKAIEGGSLKIREGMEKAVKEIDRKKWKTQLTVIGGILFMACSKIIENVIVRLFP